MTHRRIVQITTIANDSSRQSVNARLCLMFYSLRCGFACISVSHFGVNLLPFCSFFPSFISFALVLLLLLHCNFQMDFLMSNTARKPSGLLLAGHCEFHAIRLRIYDMLLWATPITFPEPSNFTLLNAKLGNSILPRRSALLLVFVLLSHSNHQPFVQSLIDSMRCLNHFRSPNALSIAFE